MSVVNEPMDLTTSLENSSIAGQDHCRVSHVRAIPTYGPVRALVACSRLVVRRGKAQVTVSPRVVFLILQSITFLAVARGFQESIRQAVSRRSTWGIRGYLSFAPWRICAREMSYVAENSTWTKLPKGEAEGMNSILFRRCPDQSQGCPRPQRHVQRRRERRSSDPDFDVANLLYRIAGVVSRSA
jgi:hypothetical protein